jgi:hypothetical protein
MYRSYDLACGVGANLDCYKVLATTNDFGMTIITLDNHYSMFVMVYDNNLE